MNKCKNIYARYRHGIPLLIYFSVYLVWFAWLEKNNTKNYYVIHVGADDYIPFCEIFILPYLLWFVYVTAVVAYLFLTNRQEYYKSFVFLATGMTIFLMVSTLWPNGHHLRPPVMPRDNVFTRMISLLWQADTPTNLWPSIHVYNSMGAHFAVMHCAKLENRRWIKAASGLLALSIILSTMFIKQHSVFDVITAIVLGAVMYVLVYRRETLLSPQRRKNHGTPQAG